ncbi:MAG: hypothetical protein ABIS14_16335 [Sphingomonas sp.]
MALNKILGALAVASLVTTPVLAAQPNAAAPLSLSHSPRAGSAAKGASQLQGTGLYVALALAAAATAGIIVAATSGKAKSP